MAESGCVWRGCSDMRLRGGGCGGRGCTHLSMLAGIIWLSSAASMVCCHVLVELGMTKPNWNFHSETARRGGGCTGVEGHKRAESQAGKKHGSTTTNALEPDCMIR
eukprot:6190984-Pleurochrysis_carterae.AAC.5